MQPVKKIHENTKICPSLEILNDLFTYDERLGILIRKKSSANASAGSVVECRNHYYGRVTIDYVTYSVHRIIWKMHYGVDAEYTIDHKDGDKTNNHISNLRLATIGQNNCNRNHNNKNTSGVNGLSFDWKRLRWKACICLHGNRIHLGRFKNKEKAIAVLNEAKAKLQKEFAVI